MPLNDLKTDSPPGSIFELTAQAGQLRVIAMPDDAGSGEPVPETGIVGIVPVTVARTLELTDANCMIRFDSPSGGTFTVPPNGGVPFPIGVTVILRQAGGGQAFLVGGAGVTLNSSESLLATRQQHATIALTKVALNEWDVTGERG